MTGIIPNVAGLNGQQAVVAFRGAELQKEAEDNRRDLTREEMTALLRKVPGRKLNKAEMGQVLSRLGYYGE